MWTPKRIVLLVMGFALFFTGYFTYSFIFGGINGLPPLPAAYAEARDTILEIPKRPPSTVEEKLRQAFGLECPELNRAIRLELERSKMVLAADSVKPDETGRLVLKPCSVAMFGKRVDGKGVEINTIRANIAYLTFDRPMSQSVNPNEMSGRKIIGAELTGDITIVNNRRTPQRDDDLELFIKTGPLYYQESNHLIWTYDDVHVTDFQSKPNPNEVRGKGMEMELVTEQTAPPTAGRKPHNDAITGVKRITLQSDVNMHLYIDGRNNFLGQPSDASKGKPAKKVEVVVPMNGSKNDVAKSKEVPPAKSHLNITTPGRFQYFFFKDYDTAHFEVTPGNQPNALPARAPRLVTVIRTPVIDKLNPVDKSDKGGNNPVDQLICEQLDLKLVRRNNKPPATTDGKPAEKQPAGSDGSTTEQSIDIETAHATGKEVTLASDTDNFDAQDVVDLLHEAKKGLTVLKGGPNLRAKKDGHKLLARELYIQEIKIPGTDKIYQKVTAIGPGEIDLLDKNSHKYEQHAYWKDTLISSKDERARTPKGELQDVLHLTGAARFVDAEHKQELKGESLKVWLSPSEKPAVEKATPAQTVEIGTQGARVDHMEALGNVSLNSPQLNIHDTGRLLVGFHDAPPSALPTVKELAATSQRVLPSVDHGPTPAPAPPSRSDVPQQLPSGPEHESSKPGNLVDHPAAQPNDVVPPPKVEETPRPIDLSARSVEATVLRGDKGNTLEKLWAEGTVHVSQTPDKPGEQGVDIKGETLQMIYHPDGDLLMVNGNEENLATLQMDKILIVGPEVNIDQLKNRVWVTGAGAMRIDSDTTLSGKPLDKKEPLTIHWHKSMFIEGRYGEFNTGIQATQQQARMACDNMSVYFDKPISLKEGNKGDKSPTVQTLLCDQNAHIEDVVYDGDKLMKYQRVEGSTISVETLTLDKMEEATRKEGDKTDEHEMRVRGPGWVHLVQRGGADPLAPPDPNQQGKPKQGAKPGAKPADDDQLKLTLVNFGATMYANTKTNFASFRRNVRVIHMPVENPFMETDANFIDLMLAKLPQGAMYLSCQTLEVYTRQEKGKNYQEMYARDQAVVQSKEFWGRAETINFDEFKDQVIFDGGKGGSATLYKFRGPGYEPEVIKGQKIIYNRTTGRFQVIDGRSLQGQ